MDSESVEALVNKGNSLVDEGKFEEAIDFYNKALEINPQDIVALANKGTALDQLGRHEEAMKCFDKVLEISPNDEEALNNKGGLLIKMGKYGEALNFFDKVLALNPHNFVTHYNKGLALGNLGRYEEAINSYDEALKIAPDYALALYGKGNALIDLASTLSCEKMIIKMEEALKLFESIWKIRNKIPDRGKQFQNAVAASSADAFLLLVEKCGQKGIETARKIKNFLYNVLDPQKYADFLEEIQLSIPADLKQYKEVIALLDEPHPKTKK